MLEAIRYIPRDLSSQTPLIDSKTNEMMILIEGKTVNIPSELFHLLYKEEEISQNQDLGIFLNAKTQFDQLTSQINSMKLAGFSEDILKKIILESLPKDLKIQEFAKNLIESVFREIK